MSVLVPDLMVYEYIHNGLVAAANRKECDNLFSAIWTRHFRQKLWDQECKRLVRSWAKLNEDSYNAAYDDPMSNPPLLECITCNNIIRVNALQLVKYVHCVAYNIEMETIFSKMRTPTQQEYDDYELLKAWRSELYQNIVTYSEAYGKLPYSEYDPNQWEPGPTSEMAWYKK